MFCFCTNKQCLRLEVFDERAKNEVFTCVHMEVQKVDMNLHL